MRTCRALRALCIVCAALLVACSASEKGSPSVDAGPSDPPLIVEHVCAQAPLDTTHATSLYEAMRCLFEGPNAPQQVVAPGTITPERIAVVRGRVLGADGQPLANARVTVLGHPEYGEVRSNAHGDYDLALNGGGLVTLRFEANGLLPAQRREPTEWREFAIVDDVTLLPESPVVNEVDLRAPRGTFARGEQIEDASGARRQDVFVRPGTRAILTLPDGSEQTLTSFHLRVTEYTRGERGPSAMPGELPPTSGYTYAAQFSLDEARAAGAARVTFDPPVIGYVDNFLSFPVGTIVPNGFYDEQRAEWEAGPNGLVVRAVDQGDAIGLDSDGDGAADGPEKLAALGVDAHELAALQANARAGQAYWRVPMPHFTPWDYNWGVAPPDDATAPETSVATTRASECSTKVSGSIIGCESQTLGEVLPISGTTFSLHYQSERMPGRADSMQLEIPLTGASYPPSLKRIDVEIEVLGRQTKVSFPPSANARHTFSWDGLDAYGRRWQGRQTARVRVGYVYDGVYAGTSRFAAPGDGVAITGDRARQELVLWTDWRGQIGGLDALAVGLGGWTLDAHHVYDPRGGVLDYGDGRQRSRERIGAVITTIAGTGEAGDDGDLGPATDAQIGHPHGIAFAPDGKVYIADDASHRIRVVAPDGTIDAFAGTGMAAFAGDRGPARAAAFNQPMGLALAPDGSLYVADAGNAAVRKIAADGTVSTVAGRGMTNVKYGEPVRATDARFVEPHALALSKDGALYIADGELATIFRLDVDGMLTLVAGGGSRSGDGPAADSKLGEPLGLAINAAGDLYFTDWTHHRVRKLDASGIITTIAGTGRSGFSGDGGPADLAQLDSPHTVDLGVDGSVYITDEGNRRVRRVAPDGRIETVAGGGEPADAVGDDGSPLDARFDQPRVILLHRDGTFWIADYGAARVRRVRTTLPGFTMGEIALASESGGELYIFDSTGKHQRTLDALTGLTLLTFEYDGSGELAAVRDAAQHVTRIERDVEGRPTAIVGPYGERTELAVDATGLLASVKNAAGESHTLTYHPGGLLATLTEPRAGPGDVHRFEYDELGRLKRDLGPTGLDQTLSRTEQSERYSVELRTKLGRSVTHTVEPRGQGVEARSVALNGQTPSLTTTTLGGFTRTSPAGTVQTVRLAGDPRFGMQAPYVARASVEVGARDAIVTTQRRSVKLRDTNDPSSLLELRIETRVEDDLASEVWNVPERTHLGTSPEGRTASSRWDERGRIVERRVGTLLAENYAYDEHDRLVRVTRGERTSSVAYDANGRIAVATDPVMRSVSMRRDAVGRVLESVLPDQTTLRASYDANDNLLSLTPPGRAAHLFEHGAGNLNTSYAAPGAQATRYEYDADARLVAVVRGDGGRNAFSYDPAGRLLESARPDGAVKLTYLASTGQLASITTTEAQLAYTYDGELLTGVRTTGAAPGELRFGYDARLRLTTERVGDSSIAFAYDRDGLLVEAGSETLTYDAHGLLSKVELGELRESYVRDGYGEPTQHVVHGASELFAEDAIRRDALGRIIAVTERNRGEVHTFEYRYHPRGWLSEVREDGALLASYAYDANGNRTSVQGAAGAVSAMYDERDRILTQGANSYALSADGELVSKKSSAGTTSYSYDTAGALRAVTLPDGTKLDYVIDGLGRRIAKKKNGAVVQAFVYRDAHRLAAELDPSGNIVSRFVYGSRGHVPDQLIRGSATYRIISDARGSVRLVVHSTTGEVAQAIDYDPYGQVTRDTNPGFQPFGYAGGLYDRDTALVRFGARDYDAETGRWTARDPILFHAGQSNLYAYVDNDPINHVDPSGLAVTPETLWDAANVAAGAASLGGNLACGNYGAAALDALGLAFDFFAAMVPLLPGGVAAILMASRGAARGAAAVPRGAPTRFIAGAEVRAGGQTMKGTADLGPTLKRIESGGSFPHRNDGSVFMNREGLLPVQPQGYYREFVHPTPGVSGPGPQRVIQGQGGEMFYTPDHYRTFIPLN